MSRNPNLKPKRALFFTNHQLKLFIPSAENVVPQALMDSIWWLADSSSQYWTVFGA